MYRFLTFTMLLLTASLTACHGGSVSVGASAEVDYDHDYHYTPPDESPQIRQAGLVDSYGNDSQYSSHGSLALDPFIDYGIFEIYWDVSSFYDYTVNLYLNNSHSLNGAVLIGTDYCGPFEPCDDYGMLVCEYTPDFYLGCGLDLDEASYNAQPIDPVATYLPSDAYINVEVCPVGNGYCEVQSIPVTLY